MSEYRKPHIIRIRKHHEKIRFVTLLAFFDVVCLPFHTLTIGGVGLLMLISLPLLVFSIPAILSRVRRTNWDKATILLAGFFAYNLLAYLWTPAFSSYSVYNYVKIIAVVMCFYCQRYNAREQKFLLLGAILSCLNVCWFMITETNIGYDSQRMTVAVFGVVQDPNYLGYLYLVPMAVAVTGFIKKKSLGQKIIFALMAFVFLFCVMITGSRGALLGLAIVAFILILERFQRLSSKILFSVAMGIVIAVLYGFVLSLLPAHIAQRFTFQDLASNGGTGRWDIWMETLRVMMKTPYKIIFGFGSGSSKYLVGWATHNFFLQLLLELGIFGLGLFVLFFWTWCRRLFGKDTMCFSVLMGCMGMAMTLSVSTIYYFWFAFILAIVCSKARLDPVGGYPV